MGSSPQSIQLSSRGLLGGTFLTGGQTASNPAGWVGFKTVDGNVVLGGITGSYSGISYLAGKTLQPPYEFLGKITNISLTTGSAGIQLFN